VASGYNLYVNLLANTGPLTAGLHRSAGQLRSFDSQLDATTGRLNNVATASRNLARIQAAASAQVVTAQGRAASATQRASALQERASRAQAYAARAAARAQEDASRSAQNAASRAAAHAARVEQQAVDAVRAREGATAQAARAQQAATQQVRAAEADLARARDESAARSAQAALAIGAALGVGVAQAIQLEKAMANVMTISQQITADNIAAFTDEIVELSTRLPQTATQLADGLYQIVSTGFDGQEALQILEVAAKGASAGLTSSETSARALLGVLKAYGMDAGAAADVMDTMFQTVNVGVISFEELAQQLGDVVPMAAAAGVEFDDMSSALAAITLSGIPAAEAVTALNMLLTRMMAPTADLRNAIKDLGYESAASAVRQDGLYVVVNKLNQAAGGTAEGLQHMWRDIRATRAALALAAASGQNYADSYAAIANEVTRAAATQRAYAIQTDTVAGQWSLFSNQARALAIDLGRALLPALEAVGTTVHTVVGAVNDLPGPMKSALGIILATSAALLLLRGGYTKVTGQIAAFRAAQAAAAAGGAAMPAVMAGASLAMTGILGILSLGVIGYAAYTASKQEARDATEAIVAALRSEREEGAQGAGIRSLAEQMVEDTDTFKAAGVRVEDAIAAIVAGGDKYKKFRGQIFGKNGFDDGTGGWAMTDEGQDAIDALDKQHKAWSDAVKKEASIATQMDIVNSKIRESRAKLNGAFDLSMLADVDKQGAAKITDEMKALAKAVGDAVDPSDAFSAAQRKAAQAMQKAGQDADVAKVKLRDYMAELRKQLDAQRNFQGNLSELAVQGYGDLADHFAELGVDAAPMLDELVGQLKDGKTKIADEMRGIVMEDAARTNDYYRLGLEDTARIAEEYGEKIARAWAKASETNDPAAFQDVTRQMAFLDMDKAIERTVGDAQDDFRRGMGLLADIAREKGGDAAAAFKDALLSGDVDAAMDSLKAIFGADLPISEPDLSQVVGAFRQAGDQANAEWSGALQLITQVAQLKGSEAAAALTSALLSGDMAAVQAQLDAIGVSVTNIPGSKNINVSVTAAQPPPVIIPIHFQRQATSWDKDANGVPDLIQKADGGLVSFYANGGINGGGVRRENHIAEIAPAGAWRVWAEPSTGGEAYLPLHPSKRARSKRILEEVAHRFGADVVYRENGGLDGWEYDPGYDSYHSIGTIHSKSTTKRGGKDVFDLAKFEKNLKASAQAAAAWRSNLSKVAGRAGQDVADALADMGEDGVALTRKMATGSSKYVKEMTDALVKLGVVARATLSDFTKDLSAATADQTAFQKNLATIAAMGYGALATRLAEQGDAAAMQLAGQAAKDKGKAASADKAAKAADATIPAGDLPDLMAIIAAISGPGVGIRQVAEKTRLDEDTIIDIAAMAVSLIKSTLGSKATTFLAEIAKASKGLAFGQGGILTPGLYATSNGIVTFAEPSTQGEAFIPLGAGVRGPATGVLADVAARFGYQLTPNGVSGPMPLSDARPGGGVQVVVVREQPAALIGSMPVTVNGTPQGGYAAADQIGQAVMRRLRNAQRGGRI
jgi:TP901 family phage tail tape measure protein